MILFENRSPPTSITISLDNGADGGIRLSGHDIGQAPKDAFGSDDYEYWIDIPAEGLRPLLEVMLADKYRDRPCAVSEFRAFCEQHDLPHQSRSWP